MPLGMEVGLGPGEIVLDGDPAPLPKRGHINPQIFGQTAGWIKMPLGTEVGLGPGHIILHGTRSIPQRGTAPPPNFLPMFVVAKWWMDQDGTWYRGRPRTSRHCVGWGPGSPATKGAQQPSFSAHVYCSQKIAHLNYC